MKSNENKMKQFIKTSSLSLNQKHVKLPSFNTTKLEMIKSNSLLKNKSKTSDNEKNINKLSRKEVFTSLYKINQKVNQETIKREKKLLLIKQDNSIEQIMTKVNQLKEKLNKKIDSPKIEQLNTPIKQINVVAIGADYQKQQLPKRMILSPNINNKNQQNKIKKASIILNPKNIKDRCINFLVKEIDQGSKNNQFLQQAQRIYKNISPQKQFLTTYKNIQQKSPNQKHNIIDQVDQDKQFHIYNEQQKKSLIKTKQKSYSSNRLKDNSYKYENPFNQKSNKHKYLKKGSNIVGLVLKQLSTDKVNQVNNINFSNTKLIEKYNQIIPQQVQAKAQQYLKIMKGRLSLTSQRYKIKQKSAKKQPSIPFNINDIMYLNKQEKFQNHDEFRKTLQFSKF